MLTAYSRVTVVTADRTVDLALPSALPLADLLPQLLRYAAPDTDAHAPASWTLSRVGASSLGLTQTLADAGVVDGDVLELRAATENNAPALVEDVRDAVEDTVDAAGGTWDTRDTGSFVAVTGAAVLLLAALVQWLVGWPLGDGTDAVVGASASVVALLATTAWTARLGRDRDARLVAVVALVWAVMLGDAVSRSLELGSWTSLVAVAVTVAVVAAVARALSDAVTAHLSATVVLAVALLVLALTGVSDVDTQQAVRVLPVLALLGVGVLPRVSLSVGGLAGADYRVRHAGRVSDADLRRRFRVSNDLLVGGLVGCALVVVVAGLVLDTDGDDWDRTLALLLALTAALRSRVFSRVQHMLPLRLAGVVVLTVVLAQALDGSDLTVWLVPAISAVTLAGMGLATIRLSEIQRARVKRTLNLVELVTVVVLIVVLAGAMGVYDALGGLF